ncbi:hypothetical protein [Acidithiobacillus concretivorus]|uniref:Restriction endonuclease n=1 Tax=Acidithiobacillus concretivorus TaxID=3063952 RepID=A0ABS5ZNS6_9PROT|nr:hypothetical protein [Acidithiobacillus concretivorus]MBU2738296.1 hypothetical protein [Acidithiobacillus concretivorus]
MKTQIIEAIKTVILEFQDNPYAFLYEEDIRATLFYEIRKRISGEIEVAGRGNPEQKYRLRGVYCEYGKKIDIACLKMDSQIDPKPHRGQDTFIYNIPVEIGIELKYRKIGDNFTVQESIKDYDKLKGIDVTNCLAIAFVQNDKELPDFLGSVASTHAEWLPYTKNLDGIFVVTKNELRKITN